MEIPKEYHQSTQAQIEQYLQHAQQLAEAGKLDPALDICGKVLDLNPDNPIAIFIAGYVFIQAGRLGLAYNLYKRLSQLYPHKSQVWNNLGRCVQDFREDKISEAIGYFEKARQLDPQNPAAHINLSLCYLNLCEPRKCIEHANRGIELQPQSNEGHNNRALAKLMLGDWTGWDDFIYSLGTKQRKELHTELPRWNGKDNVETLLIYGEQGIGDEISFSSCIPDLIHDIGVGRIIFDCDGRLETLFKETFPEIEVHGTRFAYKDPKTYQQVTSWKDQKIDAQCSIATLPMFFRRKTSDFPGEPYLKVTPSLDSLAKQYVSTLPEGLKVGVAWSGGMLSTGAQRRTLKFTDMLPILKSSGATFVSLQYRDFEDTDILAKQHGVNIVDAPDWTRHYNYERTCALINNLDLVISVNTSVVHVAGALGVECWTLTPEKPRWFYGLSGSSVPWYKTLRIFREKNSKWPIQQVASRLKRAIQERGAK